MIDNDFLLVFCCTVNEKLILELKILVMHIQTLPFKIYLFKITLKERNNEIRLNSYAYWFSKLFIVKKWQCLVIQFLELFKIVIFMFGITK